MASHPSYSSILNQKSPQTSLQHRGAIAGTPLVRPKGNNVLREEKVGSAAHLRLSYLFVPLSHVRSHLLGSKIKGNFLELLLLLSQTSRC